MENINRRYHHPMSKFMRDAMGKYMTELTCSTCQGKRLNDGALNENRRGSISPTVKPHLGQA